MKHVPKIEEFKKMFYNKNKNIPKSVLENEVNLIINIKFFNMIYHKNIMDKLKKYENIINMK